MTLTRRELLRLGLASAVALPLAGCTVRRKVTTVGRVAFTQPLRIPPLAQSHVDASGRRVFELTARTGRREFLPGRVTETWGFNGDYLGPTLRARRGEPITVNVHNALHEVTTVHWHGMHLPARMDGGPHQPIEPDGTWTPSWTIAQPASTLWYHPHPHGRSEKHVYRGLAGMFILDDADEAALDLPRAYGVDDVPLIVQDKRFHDGGGFDESDHRATGLLGDTVLVNGTFAPYLAVSTERIRLRLLNASTARIYSFGFADNRRFALIGTDGGLLARPYLTDRIQLAPAERAEVVVAMRPTERVVLRSFPPQLGANRGITKIAGGEDSFDVVELRAGRSLAQSPPVPAHLVDAPRLDADQAVAIRMFRLGDRSINSKHMDMDRIDEVATLGTTEIWQVTNHAELPHSFHVHDVQFQILTVDGGARSPELAGWKDTVYLPPSVPIRLIMQFADYADPAVPYVYHCHLLFHEDTGMMGQFVVVEPGQHPASLGGHGHDH